MKNLIYMIICLTAAACNAGTKGKVHADSTERSTPATTDAGPFDLAKLSLTENLQELMAAQSLKPEPTDSLNTTVFGFEVFRSSSPKVLRFEHSDLSGAKGGNRNYVLFHYEEKTGQLAGYEVLLYSRPAGSLIALLNKSGKLVFKKTKVSEGGVELDENGNEVKAGESEHKTFRVWENKDKGLSYFLTETGEGQKLITELTVLKPATPFGRDLMAARSLDFYKNEQSEPL